MEKNTTKHYKTFSNRNAAIIVILYLMSYCVGSTSGVENAKGNKCQRFCKVREAGSKTMKRCQFPFTYKNKTFNRCTDYKDPAGKFWCSTKVDSSGVHITRKGHWGYCQKWSYSDSCKWGGPMTELQNYLDNELGVQDHCADGEYITESIENYVGREECPCKPITECKWTHDLKAKSNNLPTRNKFRKRVVKLLRDSVCDYGSKTVRCCGDVIVKNKQVIFSNHHEQVPRKTILKKEESGQWIPDVEKGECGEDLKTQFIVCDDEEGCTATRNEFPYMALLGYDVLNNGKIFYTCGASVINKKYVMTAAHCHNEKKYVERIREVIVGEYVVGEDPDCERGRCSPPIQKFGVEKVIPHESWDSGKNGFLKGNDIALVRLDKSITLFTDDNLGSGVVPVCLPWKTNEPKVDNVKDGSKVTITGWGRITNNSYQSKRAYLEFSVATRTLRKVELPITIPGTPTYDNCRKSNDTVQFCAGGVRGFDSCSGDSGGPATYRESPGSPWYQLGIVSYGSSRCGRKDRPGAYTKVDAYLPWIEAHLEP